MRDSFEENDLAATTFRAGGERGVNGSKVFNVANLKEQMQENVLAVLDGALSTLTDGIRQAIQDQICQVIIDTIDPPKERPYIINGNLFYLQRSGESSWHVYTQVDEKWPQFPNDTIDDCHTEDQALLSYVKKVIEENKD